MKYQLIIFDWDGTLMDSIDKIVLCMQKASLQEGLLAPTASAVKDIIGLSLLNAVNTLFPSLNLSQQQSLVDAYREQYQLHQHLDTPLYDGVKELLESLKEMGYQLAVATGKARFGLNNMLEKTDSWHLFSATICADEANSKPDPLMIQLLLDELQVEAQHALMVGDSIYDLQMANNAGVDCLGVSYGVHDHSNLQQAQPIAVVDHLASQLPDYI